MWAIHEYEVNPDYDSSTRNALGKWETSLIEWYLTRQMSQTIWYLTHEHEKRQTCGNACQQKIYTKLATLFFQFKVTPQYTSAFGELPSFYIFAFHRIVVLAVENLYTENVFEHRSFPRRSHFLAELSAILDCEIFQK